MHCRPDGCSPKKYAKHDAMNKGDKRAFKSAKARVALLHRRQSPLCQPFRPPARALSVLRPTRPTAALVRRGRSTRRRRAAAAAPGLARASVHAEPSRALHCIALPLGVPFRSTLHQRLRLDVRWAVPATVPL